VRDGRGPARWTPQGNSAWLPLASTAHMAPLPTPRMPRRTYNGWPKSVHRKREGLSAESIFKCSQFGPDAVRSPTLCGRRSSKRRDEARLSGRAADYLRSAHERLKHSRHDDRAILLLIVLEDRDEAAGRGHRSGVQRMREELIAADLSRPRVQSTGLVVRAVAATDDLAVRVLPRKPGFDVILLRRDRADALGAS